MRKKKNVDKPDGTYPTGVARGASAVSPEGAQKNGQSEAFEMLASLWSVAHGMESLSKLMRAKIGITGSQRFVMRIIGMHPGISAAELASTLHLDPSTLTGVLRRLEMRKLITRKSAKDDARRAVLTLTEAGEKLNGVTNGTIESTVAKALQGVSATHIRHAKIVLNSIARELELAKNTKN